MLKKADLHCHSIHSEHPSEWFLQKLGARESYTDPLFIYKEAKRMGMDYVTITDHNCIDGAMLLHEKHPTDTIVGLEATAYFPEDRCKIHILTYGIKHIQFEIINHLRTDIYELREYLKEQNIVHSVAHASYSVNGKLSTSHLEKLILLFDYFEAVNGGRNKNSNLAWQQICENLTPDRIGDLYSRYRIEPYSETAWQKGFTGGSDDHGGIFLAKTYTEVKANSVTEFLKGIQTKQSVASGRHNDYHSLAFTIYKIAYDFSRQSYPKNGNRSMLENVSGMLFENRKLDLRQRLRLNTMKGFSERQGDEIRLHFSQMVQLLQHNKKHDIEDKLDLVYEQISEISDAFFRLLLNSLEYDLKHLNIVKLLHNVSSSLPGIFLLLPFFSSLKHMHSNSDLLREMKARHHVKDQPRKRRSLWLTDTITDLNGVSATLKQMGTVAAANEWEMRLVCSLKDSEITSELPAKIINLPFMYIFSLPYYDTYNLKIPSVLASLKQISDFDPDQIIISTPGPIGLLGILAAKLMGIKCIGIYHTDFYGETQHIVPDESASGLVLAYEKWFYQQMHEIRTPTIEYQRILEERGISVEKMGLLQRGIELDVFYPRKDPKAWLSAKSKVKGGVTLLYAGRVSQDKSLDILCKVYPELIKKFPALNLIIAGSGPYLSEMKENMKAYPRVIFTGAMPRYELAELYNAADYFVFPSVTDTFGMVILEALACGLPVIVSAQGGPQEIIAKDKLGFICADQRPQTWISTIWDALKYMAEDTQGYQELRSKCHESVLQSGDWNSVLEDILGTKYIGG
jgi:glycosyltransferase involved in cell wall biosynthesis